MELADPAWAAALFAVDPAGLGGVAVRAGAGPARDAWLAMLREILPAGAPWRRVPPGIADERLLGGLDLAATLRAGRPVAARGLLAEADGGTVVIPMAERLPAGTAARLAAVLDQGAVTLERDGLARRFPVVLGLVLLDEGIAADERPAAGLLDRLAFRLELDGGRGVESPVTRAAVAAARRRLAGVGAAPGVLEALGATAAALGVASPRALLMALRAARAAAALDGRAVAGEDDAVLAGRLVLAPRATQVPAPEQPELDAPPEEAPEDEAPPDAGGAGEDGAAALAAIPAGLLAQLAAGGALRGPMGRAGAVAASVRRGRPIGVRRGMPAAGARLNLIETLRAAAPWQRLRRAETGVARIQVRRDDFRITRFQQRTESAAIFVVDASGSSALNRLAEAKGAVELLLADCYVRRDQVALVAFRGAAATLLLPPTSSLVRAKRELAGLVGGGGTPLAAALDQAALLADAVRRRGQTPFVVLLTDGRANVARDGSPGRARAMDDALAAARAFRGMAVAALLIDTGPKPQPQAAAVAAAMGGRYLAMPYADAAALSRAVRAAEPARR
jgi:magnesium chelatase subunit D